MKELPILMCAPMVRSTLKGDKTNTRRLLKLPKWATGWDDFEINVHGKPEFICAETGCSVEIKCPYGQPGDHLWVRETWAKSNEGNLAYRASETPLWVSKWKPSIFMRREYCRIILEVVSVRVERLQEISEADAIAEGLTKLSKDGTLFKCGIPDRDGLPGTDNTGWEWQYWCASPIDAYWALWESINGKGSWDLNPWVWVVEFNRVQD